MSQFEDNDEEMKHPDDAPPKTRVRRALDEADKAMLDSDDEVVDPVEAEEKAKGKARVAQRLEGLEDWQIDAVPADLQIPKGEEIAVLRFEAKHCKGPAKSKGDRTCVLWALSVKDERIARSRMFGDATRGLEEMAKMMIRAIDGQRLDEGDPQQIERFWDEIGPRHRSMLVAWYQRTHNFSDDERLNFFVHCAAIRTAR